MWHVHRTAARRGTIYAAWALVCIALAVKALQLLWQHVHDQDSSLVLARCAQSLLAVALVSFFIRKAARATFLPMTDLLCACWSMLINPGWPLTATGICLPRRCCD